MLPVPLGFPWIRRSGQYRLSISSNITNNQDTFTYSLDTLPLTNIAIRIALRGVPTVEDDSHHGNTVH